MQNAINNLLDIVEGSYYLVAQLVITSVLGAVGCSVLGHQRFTQYSAC